MGAKLSGQVWDYELTPTERIVLLAIADHAEHVSNLSWASVGLIAWMTDLSRRSVQRCISSLRERGVLIETKPAGPRKAVTYRVDLSPLRRKVPRVMEGRHSDAPMDDTVTPLGVTEGRQRGVTTVTPEPRTVEPGTLGTASAEAGAVSRPTVDKSGKGASVVVAAVANAITRKGLPSMERVVKDALASQVRDLLRGGWGIEDVQATGIELALEWEPLRRYSKLMHIGQRQRHKTEDARVAEHERRKIEERREREAAMTPATRQQAADIAMSWRLRAALP